eukprot:3893369-Pleurochrysis_carterae.AAC.1
MGVALARVRACERVWSAHLRHARAVLGVRARGHPEAVGAVRAVDGGAARATHRHDVAGAARAE